MKEFTIKYNMKLGNDNIELEFKGNNEEEFKTTFEKLKEEYIPFISNTKNKTIKSKNNSFKNESSISNNKKKDNKNQRGGYKKIELNLK